MRSRLTALRGERTLHSNRLRASIAHILTAKIKWNQRGEDVPPDSLELPSWWPFWSDTLYANTRRLVRLARELDAEEARVHGYDPQLTEPK